LKDRTSGTELYEAIQDVLTGGAPMSSRIARKVIGFFEQHSRSATSLSGREEEVLRRLEDGLAYKEIAGVLSISVNTVRKHIGSIYQKLHVHSRTAAAKHAATQHQSRQSM
jgi:DNA-binding NarL/FixJ family response regulator